MATSYSIDPSDFLLDRFFSLTEKRRMLPSRIALHNEAKQRLAILKNHGFATIKDVLVSLKSKEQVSAFSLKTGIPASYLVLLRREAGSYVSKPVKLSEFPGIPLEYAKVLESKNIRNSRDFFEFVQTDDQRQHVSKETGIPIDRLKELYSLCDLVRINGIGGLFARILYEAGMLSVEQFAATDYRLLYRSSMDIIKSRGIAGAHFVEEDMVFCVHYARILVELTGGDV